MIYLLRQILPTLLLFCTVGFLFGGNPALAQSGGTEPAISARSSAVDDAAIARRLGSIYREINGLNTINVQVKAGVVTLTGKVANNQLIAQAEALANRVEGVVAVTNNLEEETSVDERLTPVFERVAIRLNEAIRYLPLIAVALLLWLLFILVGWFMTSRDWPWSRIAPNIFIADLLKQFVWIVFILAGALLALDIIGAGTIIGTVLGAAGIVGLAVGFAVRDTVENYLASILLSLRQPFRPKDFVDIEGQEGFVTRLTSRATILLDASGNHVRIPNAVVFKATIINYTRNPERRFEFDLGVDSESALDVALETGISRLNDLEFALDNPPANGWIEAIGDSNIVLRFCAWIDQNQTDFVKARSEAMRLTKKALESAGFALPEPIYRLKIDSMPTGAALLPSVEQTPQENRKPEPKAPAIEDKAHLNVEADSTISRQIDEERDNSKRNDLLTEQAPSELD
ncbi:mechanosensitive ion channel domain-containing protein [Rhizobium sp. L1K21]|uniref:mechanosensitive ion channel domain-containing protein n=1 Tax=Rhizobium sp. L1K21 TaxID=2954933 RepID=UPI0020931904|nr:mechanosensitive ion channel domain-containing protein [Rhizobium sp. L1K21]MCO6187737.1 mechanosensitive ion channel [Rhizobium sp. L1K21]